MPSRKQPHVIHDKMHGVPIVRVELTRGQYATLNANDWDRIAETFGTLWNAKGKPGSYSAVKAMRLLSGRQSSMTLPRAVMRPAEGQQVRTINGDSLDARRANLRVTGKPAPEPDPLSLPECLATNEDRAAARRKLAGKDSKTGQTGAPQKASKPKQGSPTGDSNVAHRVAQKRYLKTHHRPARIERLARRLVGARCRRHSVPESYLTAQQRRRSYLTAAETNHVRLVIELRRAEGLAKSLPPSGTDSRAGDTHTATGRGAEGQAEGGEADINCGGNSRPLA